MKYLFTFAFKTVQNSLVYLRHVDEALKKGKSTLLVESLGKLQGLLPLLENITTPVYTDKQEIGAKELHLLLSDFILLPEHMELSLKELEVKCHTFLHQLDPFFIETIESNGIRKARLIEELMGLQDYLEGLIENFETQQVSIVLLMAMVEEKLDEIQYIDMVGFSKEETKELHELLQLGKELHATPTEKGAMTLLAKAISLENLLRNKMCYKDALEILDAAVKESTHDVKSAIETFDSEHVRDAMFLFSKYAFSDETINFSLDELFTQYKLLMEEEEEAQILFHLKNFSHHLDIVKQKLSSVEGLIEIDQSALLDDDEED